jgi:hypothetical protein
LGTFLVRSQSSVRATSAQANAQSLARRAMQRIMSELDGATKTALVPDPTNNFGTDTLVFKRPQSVSNAGVITWTNSSRLSIVPDDGETINGADDNSNGLVDECKLVLTQNVGLPSETQITLCHGVPNTYPGETTPGVDDNGNGVVDERGFNIQRVGDLLFVRLAVSVVASDGQTATWTCETALVLHN